MPFGLGGGPGRVAALLLCVTAMAAGPLGCGNERKVHGEADPANGCSRCHGGADNAAPPTALNGAKDPTDRVVGAHQAHVRGGPLAAPIACSACHVVPATVDAPGHIDGDHATVTFGALARTGGADPRWTRETVTCSSAYCHGATLHGGALTAPAWNAGAGQAACGACHGLPPPPPHVQNPDCGRCHLGYTAGSVVAATHVDGKVDVKRLECNGCHGSATSAAPPIGTAGETATTTLAVGAHQQHLTDGAIRAHLRCEDCHVLPTQSLHADGKVELDWGELATAGGARPSWNRAAATCGATYCHGGTLAVGGGTLTAPVWTRVGEGQASCGTCHAVPPPLPHPARADCNRCHPGTLTADGKAIDVAGGKHVNGTLDVVPLTCTLCHGTDGVNAAPPVSTTGESATSAIAVGAHQKHVRDGAIRKAVGCEECHVVPTAFLHANGTVDLRWGALAANGTTPVWRRDAATCSSTYCHGATLALAGGTAKTPVWTAVSDGPTACDACHGAPPAYPHPQAKDCSRCHAGTVRADGTIDVAGGKHIDGTVQVDGSGCTACHGTQGVNPAPPYGTRGETLTTQRAVGAHQKHVVPGTIRNPLACGECHEVVLDLSHANGEIPLPFTGIGSFGTTPVWNGATCASTYCHGATLGAGGAATTPGWTTVSAGATACDSCHGDPPPLPHPQNPDCHRCHDATVLATGAIDLAGGKHIDGSVEVAGGCTVCHGTEGVNPAPPVGTSGETLTTQRAVGAHQKHVTTGGIHAAFTCSACHEPVTDLTHVDGTIPMPFTGLASFGTTPSWNGATCASTYCHGATLAAGGRSTAPTWTVVSTGTTACDSCHGAPPPLPHPQNTSCATCHPETVLPGGAIYVAGGKHIDGVIEVAGGCTTCHGTEGVNPAPPVGTKGETLTTQRAVGAHQKHVTTGAIRTAFACTACHEPVTDLTHADGTIPLPFAGLASQGTTPAWNGTTCASTYCHGATLAAGGAATTPSWTVVSTGATACNSCHGFPPPAPHPQNTNCAQCHPQTVLPGGAINLATGAHIDGNVQVAGGCTTCHGTEGVNPAPPVGTNGEALTTQRAVGAHQKHVTTGAIHAAFTCSACHEPVSDLTHADGTIPLPFTGLASQGTAPVWNGTTCASTYCHGATLAAGGKSIAPAWTVVSAGATACDSCHGAPPPLPHPQNTSCAQCHPQTVLPGGAINLATGAHIDGNVQVAGGCTTCHGTEGVNPAPPLGTNGETLTTQRAVGAHQKHVTAGTIHGAFTCTACHEPVTDLTHADGTIPMPFTGLASHDTTPVWNGTTCASTYCHGATLAAGGAATTPSWTVVSTGATACSACHGFPPPAPHPQNTNCAQCHPQTVLPGGAINLATGAHIDGNVQVAGGCTTCHGTEGVNPAPPVGTNGETLTTQRAVGAHQKHVTTGGIHAAFTCSACHEPVSDLTHADGTIPLPFTGLASQGTAPVWNGTTCASTYCHGATLAAGGATTTPTWTSVGPGQTSCASCHGAPPPAPHPQSGTCATCHPETVLDTGVIDVVGGKHIDGKVQVAGGCTVCHGTEGKNPAPPLGTNGETETTQLAVGAHQKHVTTGNIRAALLCTDCHEAVTDLTHVDGTVEMPFGALASTAPAAPAWTRTTATCSSVYCHGATLAAGGEDTAPVWTNVSAGDTACTSCHGFPPPAPHPPNPLCNSCHPATVYADGRIDVDGGRHINGVLDVTGLTCSSCHGSLASPAPPVGTRGETETTQLAVGAHAKHVFDGPIRAKLLCEDCHPVPELMLHSNGTVELAFGTLASSGDANPLWAPAQATCSSTYCHGATLAAGGSTTTPVWTDVSPGQTSCGSCHGAPPPPPHPADTSCATCHPLTVKADGSIDTEAGHHIDGKIDASGACGACHPVPGKSGAHAAHAGFGSPDVPQYGDLRILETYSPTGGDRYLFGCGHCHPVDGAKHMDSKLEVELGPAGAASDSLKARNAAGAAYDPASGRCSGVYCHSSGQALPQYATTPGWTSGEQQLRCDACHGNPPRYASGGAGSVSANSHLGFTDQGREFGHYAGLGGPSHASKHGGTGADAAPITCQTCHYATTNPTQTGPSGFYWLNTTGSYALEGGDPARLDDPLWKATQCVTCHGAGAALAGAGRVMPLTHVNGRRDVVFDPRTTLPPWSALPPAPNTPTRPYWVAPSKFCEEVPPGGVLDGTTLSIDLSRALYDPQTKTCSGVGCHLGDTPIWGRPYVSVPPPASSGMTTCCRCHTSRCGP